MRRGVFVHFIRFVVENKQTTTTLYTITFVVPQSHETTFDLLHKHDLRSFHKNDRALYQEVLFGLDHLVANLWGTYYVPHGIVSRSTIYF